MHLLTSSRIKQRRTCPRADWHRYEQGLVSTAPESGSTALGTAVHSGLESWWTAWQIADGMEALDGALIALQASGPLQGDDFAMAKARAMLLAYDARWSRWAAGVTVLGVEVPFRTALRHPISGQPAKTWAVAGKIDLLLQLADGRVALADHKCLAGDARIFDHATGTYETARDLYERGTAPVVTAMRERGNLGATQALPLRLAAVRPIYRVATLGGRSLRVSGNHPVFTARGWVYAADLTTDDWVGTPRHLISATPDASISDEAIRLIGYMIGDGSLSNMTITKGHPGVIADVVRCGAAVGEPGRVVYPADRVSHVKFSLVGPVRALMTAAGFSKETLSKNKRIPFHLALSDRQIGQLVGALWSTDGCVDAHQGRKLRIVYTSVSRELCVDVQHALQRLGIVANARTTSVAYKGDRRPVTQVQVVSRESKRRFIALALEGVVPVIRSAIPLAEASRYIPTSNQGSDTSRQPKPDAHLWWDRVESVEVQGEEQTYDLEVPGAHTFVVDGIVTHNTTSADARSGSDYSRRLTLDPQVSTYFLGCEALGMPADLALWDVLRKPDVRPLLATPAESRVYTKAKDRACKECAKKKSAPAPHFDDEAGVWCAGGRVQTDPGGALKAGQREWDETPEAYQERCMAALAGDAPEGALSHIEVVRSAAEVEAHGWALWHTVREIEETRKAVQAARGDVRAVPQNADACLKYGTPCPYLPLCEGTANAADVTRYRRLPVVHGELPAEIQGPRAA